MSEVLRLDMHVHTSFSHDGLEPPARLVKRAAEIGLDGLAITDHNTQGGVGEAIDAGRELDIIVIPGVEVSCREGHILAYGSEDFGFPAGQAVGEVVSAVKARHPSCIVAPAHPFDLYRAGMGWAAAGYRFDAVETVNSHSIVPRAVVLPMARKMGVGEVGGSDAHVLRGLGKGLTLVPADGRTILQAVARSGRACGGFDPVSMLMQSLEKSRRGGNHGVRS